VVALPWWHGKRIAPRADWVGRGKSGLARRKTPERQAIVDDYPRAPAGKILKARLREQLRE